MGRHTFFSRLRDALGRRAGVALVVALSMPMLVAMTGLSVGVGTWYQQQQSLQNAADAAATAAALNDATFGQTTATGKSAAAAAIALTAADNATNGQFNFAGGAGGAAVVLSAAVPSSSLTTYTATATIPRASVFTRMAPGLFGIAAGYQRASATVELKAAVTAPACIFSTDASAQQAVYATGGARLTASNCSVYATSSACNANNGDADAIAVDPSAQVVGAAVISPGCIYANTNGGAYVGGPNGDTSVVDQHAPVQGDPLAALGAPPPWPLMPNTPVAPTNTNYTSIGSNLGYNTWSSSQGNCTYLGNYSANCELFAGAYTGLNNVGVNSLLLNENASAATTYISGGLAVNANNFLTFNGNAYYVDGGMRLTTSGAASLAAGNYNILGGTNLQNGSYSIGAGTDYFSGASSASGTATTWGLQVNTPALTLGAGTYYMNGGATFPGSNPQVTFGQGTYLMSAYSGSSSGALNDNNANITFTGGTYFFDGGLTIQGNGTVSFGPGIYYIRNGNLNFQNGSHVTANGATFVLEGTASYQLDGGATALNMSAPSSNCVAPTAYPLAADTLPSANTTLPNAYAPYDGTGGEGICGVLIYQQRGDTTADNIIEGATSTVTGIIYAPGGALSVSGGASISATAVNGSAGTLAFIQDTFSLTGSGAINVSLGANSPIGTGGSGGARQALLIN